MLTPEQRQIVVRATWDTDANVWTATSSDVPGLAAEADTLENLAVELDHLIPELLALNNVSRTPEDDLTYRIEARLDRTIPHTP
jgi:hypothetical protein